MEHLCECKSMWYILSWRHIYCRGSPGASSLIQNPAGFGWIGILSKTLQRVFFVGRPFLDYARAYSIWRMSSTRKLEYPPFHFHFQSHLRLSPGLDSASAWILLLSHLSPSHTALSWQSTMGQFRWVVSGRKRWLVKHHRLWSSHMSRHETPVKGVLEHAGFSSAQGSWAAKLQERNIHACRMLVSMWRTGSRFATIMPSSKCFYTPLVIRGVLAEYSRWISVDLSYEICLVHFQT